MLDTRNKRGAAIACGLGFRTVYPLADGAIGAGDRQQAAAMARELTSPAGAAAARRLLLLGVG